MCPSVVVLSSGIYFLQGEADEVVAPGYPTSSATSPGSDVAQVVSKDIGQMPPAPAITISTPKGSTSGVSFSEACDVVDDDVKVDESNLAVLETFSVFFACVRASYSLIS